MIHELRKRGLKVQNQVPIPDEWDGEKMDVGLRAYLLVEHRLT